MTNYKMTKPCDNCPFRRSGGVRLTRARLLGIVNAEGVFPCHKTTGVCGTKPAEESMCAGFMCFRENIEQPNQLMRIAERVGMYDASKLQDRDQVFDNLDEALDAQMDAPGKRRRRVPVSRGNE
jgi:hypothetical protein